MWKFYLFLIICLILYSCDKKRNFESEIELACDVSATINSETKDIYPYNIGLKKIIFSDSIENNYIFEVVDFDSSIQTVRSPTTLFTSEVFQYKLYCAELDFHLRILLRGSAATRDCPDTLIYADYVSISGPLESGTLEEGQSSNSVSLLYNNTNNIIIPPADIDSILIHNKSFSNVYIGKGDFKTYFNFDYGVIGIINENLSLKYHDKIY